MGGVEGGDDSSSRSGSNMCRTGAAFPVPVRGFLGWGSIQCRGRFRVCVNEGVCRGGSSSFSSSYIYLYKFKGGGISSTSISR